MGEAPQADPSQAFLEVTPTLTAGDLIGPMVQLRNTELQVLWTRFNVHLVINSGFLLAVVSARSGTVIASHYILASIFGFILSLVWLISEKIGRTFLKTRDEAVQKFRALVKPDVIKSKPDFEAMTLFSFSPIPHHLFRQAFWSTFLISMFMIAWAAILVGSIRCWANPHSPSLSP